MLQYILASPTYILHSMLPHRAVCVDPNDLDAEVLMHSLHHHDVVPRGHEAQRRCRADGIGQQLLAVRGGRGKEREKAAADKGLTGIAPVWQGAKGWHVIVQMSLLVI